MRRLLASGTLALALLASLDAKACQHDRECPAASHCVFVFGQGEGFCERGVSPVAGQEVRRPRGPDDPRSGEGVPCEFAGDCAEGLTCTPERDSTLRMCRR